ncbi:MAG TPA: hypothetical protein VL752_11330 [Acidisoma sp.]|uniref:hypothetical protein n=1 Tax=Acidisoma sp. TaxID=1872115 RepID=UPI002C6B6446|nr:hypothetical protein [Acidisoma sp.]HTI01527.1 hypothetical protein [Acidisoma sp.]
MAIPGTLHCAPPFLVRCAAGPGLLILALLALAQPGLAQGWIAPAAAPRSAFFGGVGLGIQGVDFGHQSLYAVGTSRNYAADALVSVGSAWGPGSVDPAIPVTTAPEIRLGYYRHFGTSPWLWGMRVSYADLLAEETVQNVDIPQAGIIAYASTQSYQPFTGTAVVQSYRVRADSRFGAMPFIGHDLGQGFVYLGLGGTMTHATTELNGLVGYADINGQTVNVSGAPQDFQSSGWVLGAGATLGGTYFLTHDWFLDIAYSFTETAAQVGRYFSSFTNTTTNPGVTTTGDLYGQSSERMITHGITITINRRF